MSVDIYSTRKKLIKNLVLNFQVSRQMSHDKQQKKSQYILKLLRM